MAVINVVTKKIRGGGRVYFQVPPATDWIEFGSVKNFKYSQSEETDESTNHDGCLENVDDEFTKRVDVELSFTSENISAENLAKAVKGEITDKTVAIGEELPDGTIATAEVQYKEVEALQVLMQKMPIKFIGAKCRGRQIVDEFYSVSLSSSGDITPQSMDDFAKLEFTGKVLVVEDGGKQKYFRTSLI